MKKTVVVVDGDSNKPMARITWDGEKLESDNEDFLAYLKKEFSCKDGETFLERVLMRFKSGYMHAYRIGEK